MAINYGDDGNKKKDVKAAMAILQKWSGPIYEQAAKRGFGGTTITTKYDPKVTAELMKDIPSTAEIVLSGISGAIQGYSAGKDFATGKDAKTVRLAGAMGGAIGGYTGAASGSRAGNQAIGSALNSIATFAAKYEEEAKQKALVDAMETMHKRFADLNGNQDPAMAVPIAKEKQQLIANLSEQMWRAGVAPDKAMQATEALATMADPRGAHAPIAKRINAAVQDYQLSAKTPKDKDAFQAAVKGLLMEKNVAEGKLPVNMGKLAAASGQAQVASGQPIINQVPGGAVQINAGVVMAARPPQPPPTPVQQMAPPSSAPVPYAAQTNMQGVPSYLQPNPASSTSRAGASQGPQLMPATPVADPAALQAINAGKDPITKSIVPQIPESTRDLAGKIEVMAGKNGDKISDKYVMATAEIESSKAQLNALGGSKDPTINSQLQNIKVANENLDKLMEIVVSGRLPDDNTFMADFASKTYLEGRGMKTPWFSATVGKGERFKNVLTEDQIQALNAVELYWEAASTALVKIGDPGSVSAPKEQAGWLPGKPEVGRGGIPVNAAALATAKEIVAMRAATAPDYVRNVQQGTITETIQKNSFELGLEAQKIQLREIMKPKRPGITFDEQLDRLTRGL